MLKYLESKFNEHPKNMVSFQRLSLSDFPNKEENESLVAPIKEYNYSKSTPYAPEVDPSQYLIPVVATESYCHAHWI